MPIIEIFLGGVATLFATLIGVWTAFKLDRQAEESKKRKRVLQHLKAVREELNQNKLVSLGNRSLISKMQEKTEPESDHYAPTLFMTDAWDAAIEDQLIDVVSPETYHELQSIYQKSKSTNELIRRLRVEAIDPRLGEMVEEGNFEFQHWTYSVHYYNEDSDDVDILGLGPLISRRCDDLAGETRELHQKIGEVISDIEVE